VLGPRLALNRLRDLAEQIDELELCHIEVFTLMFDTMRDWTASSWPRWRR
jgi:hypothetical protein